MKILIQDYLLWLIYKIKPSESNVIQEIKRDSSKKGFQFFSAFDEENKQISLSKSTTEPNVNDLDNAMNILKLSKEDHLLII